MKPSVFISYAHKDGMDFTRRLAFALGLYSDVFWDLNLQSGEYPEQLYQEIRSRDYFLFVLSPYSRGSDWCKQELEYAQQNKNDKIMLAKIYSQFGDKELEGKYTFGDFTQDFEQGFRRLTAMILGEPCSSWEHLAQDSDEEVIGSLQKGLIPSPIAKSIAEWALAEKLWPCVVSYIENIEEKPGKHFFRGNPRTPRGILQQCDLIGKQFAKNRDAAGGWLINEVSRTVGNFLDDLFNVSDANHSEACEIAFNILTNVQRVLQLQPASRLNANELYSVQNFFYFDAAEKIRELINEHARRSRYLY